MEWIYIADESELPTDKTIIVEDFYGWMGQAYLKNGKWVLETFGQVSFDIEFERIIKYFVVAS